LDEDLKYFIKQVKTITVVACITPFFFEAQLKFAPGIFFSNLWHQ